MKPFKKFKTIVLSLALAAGMVAFSPSSGAARQSELKIEWLFDIKDGEYTPEGKVYLVVGKRKFLILPDATENYSVIARKDYERNEIPRSAVSAIFGWYAGAGKTLYVARRKNRLLVFIKYADEGAPDFSFELLKAIRLKR